jgi:hypothetical protein
MGSPLIGCAFSEISVLRIKPCAEGLGLQTQLRQFALQTDASIGRVPHVSLLRHVIAGYWRGFLHVVFGPAEERFPNRNHTVKKNTNNSHGFKALSQHLVQFHTHIQNSVQFSTTLSLNSAPFRQPIRKCG